MVIFKRCPRTPIALSLRSVNDNPLLYCKNTGVPRTAGGTLLVRQIATVSMAKRLILIRSFIVVLLALIVTLRDTSKKTLELGLPSRENTACFHAMNASSQSNHRGGTTQRMFSWLPNLVQHSSKQRILVDAFDGRKLRCFLELLRNFDQPQKTQ